MDVKGDDSGSDTLDQSLQRKCVVADDDSSLKQPDTTAKTDNAADQPTIEPGGSMSEEKDSPASALPTTPPPSTPTAILSQPNSSSASPSTSSSSSTSTTIENTTANAVPNVGGRKQPVEHTTSRTNSKEDYRGFESKVRQISNDLKDTTIADENSLEKVDDRQESTAIATNADAVSSQAHIPPISEEPSFSGSTSATTSTATAEQRATTSKNDSDGYDSDRTITYESPSKRPPIVTPEAKRPKKTAKKVRFKLNKGKRYSSDPEDDDDDEDEFEVGIGEEDEKDTLNESVRSKVMRIPLSFVSPHEEEDECLIDGLSTSPDHTAEPEMEDPPSEGGIEIILGKLSQLGKIQYLFRYVDKPGLQWESEEVLETMCPTLIKSYEDRCAREREQDLHYVLHRKRARQQEQQQQNKV